MTMEPRRGREIDDLYEISYRLKEGFSLFELRNKSKR